MDKTCLECGVAIRGRMDKKFCSDLCRNSFNNKLNSDCNNFVRNVNNALRKNRRILESILQKNEKITISKQVLAAQGFNFSLTTTLLPSEDNGLYHCCYEYGYRALEPDVVMVVKKPDDTKD